MPTAVALSKDLLKPTLRLFVSVDIVGSTKYKQSLTSTQLFERSESIPTDDQPKWLRPFAALFDDFHKQVLLEWGRLTGTLSADLKQKYSGEPPRIWKAYGDELILVQEVVCELQPLLTVACIAKVTWNFRNTLRTTYSPKLDLKAAAWLAGFPVNNSEVILGIEKNLAFDAEIARLAKGDWFFGQMYAQYIHLTSPSHDDIVEYLGPQIDLGFRLREYASPRKFLLSVDLALMITDTWQQYKDNHSNSYTLEGRLHFEGIVTLEGVLDGADYPLIWYNLHHASENALYKAEQSIAPSTPTPLIKIREYCKAYLAEHAAWHWMIEPYIVNDGDVVYGAPNDTHAVWAKNQKKRFEDQLNANQALASQAPDTDASESQSVPSEKLDPVLGELNRNE